jgi:MFS superfamily sulfate permease-like transporter
MVLLFLTAPLAYMPEAVLSAVVFLIGIDLVDLKGMRSVLNERRSEFWVALITALTVVAVGVEQGILLAIGLSLIDHTRHGYAPKNAVLVPSDTGEWRPHPWASRAQALPGLIIYHFAHSMYYANMRLLEEEIMDLVNSADPPLRWFCIDASAVDDVDYSAAETVRSLHRILTEKGIHLVVAQVLEDVRVASSHHMRELFGDEAVFDTLADVAKEYQRQAVTVTKPDY